MISAPERLLTARLAIRPIEVGDAPVIFDRWTSHPAAMKYLPWRTQATVDETHDFLADFVRAHAAGERYRYLAIDNAKAEPIGCASVRIDENCRVELGFVIFPDSQGQGYALEMIRAIIDWSFRQPGVFRVQAVCDAENIASARVMEKAGMHEEALLKKYAVPANLPGEPRDHLLYAIVR